MCVASSVETFLELRRLERRRGRGMNDWKE
jgi:hypothetical protein